MKCERRDLAIAKLAGGDLSGWRAARLQRHVDSCVRCGTLYADLGSMRAKARDSHLHADSTGNDSVVDAVLARVADRDSHGYRRRVRIRVAGGAVLAAVLIGIVMVQLPVAERSVPPQARFVMTPDIPAPIDLAAIEHSDVIIRMVTNNPDVVILWLGDSTGGL